MLESMLYVIKVLGSLCIVMVLIGLVLILTEAIISALISMFKRK